MLITRCPSKDHRVDRLLYILEHARGKLHTTVPLFQRLKEGSIHLVKRLLVPLYTNKVIRLYYRVLHSTTTWVYGLLPAMRRPLAPGPEKET